MSIVSSNGFGDEATRIEDRSREIPSFAMGLAVGLSLIVVGLIIFRHFVFGNSVLLYKDIGADSLNDTYPYFVHLSDYLRHNGLPSWSFTVGMGQNLYYLVGSLVWEPRCLVAERMDRPRLGLSAPCQNAYSRFALFRIFARQRPESMRVLVRRHSVGVLLLHLHGKLLDNQRG